MISIGSTLSLIMFEQSFTPFTLGWYGKVQCVRSTRPVPSVGRRLSVEHLDPLLHSLLLCPCLSVPRQDPTQSRQHQLNLFTKWQFLRLSNSRNYHLRFLKTLMQHFVSFLSVEIFILSKLCRSITSQFWFFINQMKTEPSRRFRKIIQNSLLSLGFLTKFARQDFTEKMMSALCFAQAITLMFATAIKSKKTQFL